MAAAPLPFLGGIADLLLRDLQAFGLFAGFVRGRHTQESLAEYARPRLRLLALASGALASHGAPRTAAWRLPYCYLRQDWPAAMPIAGTTAEPTAPDAPRLGHSIFSNWLLSLSGSLDGRLRSAALWMTYRHGFAAAVDYLLDLLAGGFALDPGGVARTILWLTRFLPAEGSDAQGVERLLGGRIPATAAGWMDALSPEEGLEEAPPVSHPARVQEVIFTLINRCLETIAQVRWSSRSLDAWLLGHAKLHALTEATLRACHALSPDPPLTLRSVLSQLEEVKADGPAVLLVQKEFLPFDFSFAAMGGLGLIFRGKAGTGWEERFFEERVLVPAALRDRVFAGGLREVPLPPRWQRLSWRLVSPVRAGLLLPGSLFLGRSQLPAAESLLADEPLRETLESQEIREPAAQRQVVEDRLDDRLDWSASRYDREAVDAAVRAALDRTSYHEIRSGFRASREETPAEELAEIDQAIGGLLALYPWNSSLHLEMAITRDRQERPREAVKHLLAAILLDPAGSMPWRSLSVVMRRIDHPAEAVVASIVADYLEEAGEEAEAG